MEKSSQKLAGLVALLLLASPAYANEANTKRAKTQNKVQDRSNGEKELIYGGLAVAVPAAVASPLLIKKGLDHQAEANPLRAEAAHWKAEMHELTWQVETTSPQYLAASKKHKAARESARALERAGLLSFAGSALTAATAAAGGGVVAVGTLLAAARTYVSVNEDQVKRLAAEAVEEEARSHNGKRSHHGKSKSSQGPAAR